MRLVIQRVAEASVTIEDSVQGAIGPGLLILMAAEPADTDDDIEWLAGKVVRLRVFPDEQGVMNRSILEAGGDVLLVSQFTLYASTRKGNRPSYSRAAPPDLAIPLYQRFEQALAGELGKSIQTGVFGADMKVALINDGPVTILIDSRFRE